MNTCPVSTPAEWYRCLQEANAKPTGYCVPNSFIGQHIPPPVVADEGGGVQPGVRHLSAVVPQAHQQHQDQQNNQESHLQKVKFVNGSVAGMSSQDCCPPHLASTHICFTHMASGINTKVCRSQ